MSAGRQQKDFTGLLILNGTPTNAIKIESIRYVEVDDKERTLPSGDGRCIQLANRYFPTRRNGDACYFGAEELVYSAGLTHSSSAHRSEPSMSLVKFTQLAFRYRQFALHAYTHACINHA